MESRVANSEIGVAIEQIVAGFAALQSAGIEPANARDSITLIQEVEQVRRLADHAAVEVMSAIDERRFHLGDGHSTAKAMVRHHARLSKGEAAARERVARLTETCPDIGEAYRNGSIGTDQIRSLSLVHANPRIRHLMPARQDWFLAKAETLRHIDFEARINRWKRLVDEDGPMPPNELAHEDRNARMTQNFDTTWDFVASFASMQGLQTSEVFDHYIDAETVADWEKARAEHGDAATSEHLPRTVQQRRADALWQIFIDAAANPNSAVPADFMNNIMWDPDTFEAMAVKLFGEEYNDAIDIDIDIDVAESDTTAPTFPRDCIEADTIGCQTIDGIPIDPTEMFATSIVGRIRRVLIDAKSMVIDQGVARRFTGSARLAVKLSHTHCVWPGCCTPVSKCETDHVLEHSREGRTNPGNGAPLCGKHNRWKQKGFTIYRDHYGSWHTLRPDGTEIPV
jgi:hypothetical protein